MQDKDEQLETILETLEELIKVSLEEDTEHEKEHDFLKALIKEAEERDTRFKTVKTQVTSKLAWTIIVVLAYALLQYAGIQLP